MDRITELACAKINICLDVTGIRDDGYHSIESVMLCTTLADIVTVSLTDSFGITISCSDKSLPTDEKNLAYKAALEFFSYLEKKPNVHIDIVKRIPDKAGLAGGSADAAAVLRALNSLTGSYLPDEELRRIAENIGSDVIFCVSSDPSFVSGRGETIDPSDPLPDCTILIAKGKEGVKTPGAYRALDEMFGDYGERNLLAKKCLEAMSSGNLEKIGEAAFNIFEDVTIPNAPEIQAIKNKMLDNGAVFSLMSGSGSAVFGVFTKEENAKKCNDDLKDIGIWTSLCKPVS